MKGLNSYILEKLHIGKGMKTKNIDSLMEFISKLTLWEDLPTNERFRKLLEKYAIDNMNDFKYIYRSAGWPKSKLSKEALEYYDNNIKAFIDYPNHVKEYIMYIFENSKVEIVTGDEDLSNTVGIYTQGNKLRMLEFHLFLSKTEDWYLIFVL